jgi:hypothetical protein
MKMLTGNRLLLIGLVEVAWIVTVALMQYFRDDKWSSASFYNRSILLPGLLPAVALGMAAVMGERDVRHLEMTLASPGGRYQVWSFRLGALALTCFASSLGCALLTWVGISRDVPLIESALHATVPLIFVGVLTVFLSLLFNGAASAALVTSGYIVFSGMILQAASANRFDLFVNPLAPPESLLDPAAWFRILVFNRGLYLVGAGLCVAGALGLLQRRERLL